MAENNDIIKSMTFCLDIVSSTETEKIKHYYTRLLAEPKCSLGGQLSIGDDYTPTLSKIEYDKEVYKPSEVTFTFTGQGTLNNTLSNTIKKYFIDEFKWVSLVGLPAGKSATSDSITNNDLVKVVSYHYVQRYELSYNANGNYTFILHCYSFDRKLTLSKYCNVYSGKRLASDILNNAITNDLADIKKKISRQNSDKDHALSDISQKRLVMLGYQQNGKISDSKKKNDTVYGKRTAANNDNELVHPYLVQYNESVYDLVVRTAHRCGELLYFENGMITMGLPDSTRNLIFNTAGASPTTYNDKMCSCSKVIKEEYCAEIENNIGSYYENSVMGPMTETGSKVRDIEFSSDEDQHIITEDDNRYKAISSGVAYNFCASMFTSGESIGTSLFMNAAKAGLEVFDRTVIIPSHVKKDYNKDFIGTDDTTKYTNNLLFGTDKNNNKEYAVDEEYISNANNKYLRKIEYWEEQVEQQVIDINFASALPNHHIGDALKISNIGGDPTGVIVRMHGVYDSINSKYTNNVTIVPFVDLGTKKIGSLSKLPLPPRGSYLKGNERAVTIEHYIKSQPLEAIVTDNNDPLRMGRVRVRYPWQPEDPKETKETNKTTNTNNCNRSPWIRVTTPFAGGGDEKGGFTMIPSIGEHVMLNYTDGNIERPFVVGSLYYRNEDSDPNKSHLPSAGFMPDDHRIYSTRYKTRSIVSGNGHALVFRDLGDTNVFSMAVPLVDTIGKLAMVSKYKEEDDYQNPIPIGTIKGGGVTMKDGSNLCTISLNPEDRNITINSCFGDVKINAFTGITINAPNGDVCIKGKNISLQAGNNITIEAGKNLGKSWSALTTGSAFVGTLIGMAIKTLIKDKLGVDMDKTFDLSFLRSVLEIALKPVEGTLKISTQRNMVMTAGTGRVTLDSSLLSDATTFEKAVDTNTKTDSKFSLGIPFGKSTFAKLNSSKDEKLSDDFYMSFIKFLKIKVGIIQAYYYQIETDFDAVTNEINSLQAYLQTNSMNVSALGQNNYHLSVMNNNSDECKKTIFTNANNTSYNLPDDFISQNIQENDGLKFKNDVKDRLASIRKKIKYFQNGGKYFDFTELSGKLNKIGSLTFETGKGKKTINITYNIGDLLVELQRPYKKISDWNSLQANKDLCNKNCNTVIKAMIVNTLLQNGISDYVKIRVSSSKRGHYFTASGYETTYENLKDYIDRGKHTYQYSWSDFVGKIMAPGQSAPSRLEEAMCTTLSNVMSQTTGGLYSYEGGKHTLFPSAAKLFNVGGEAGPRGMSAPDAVGRILISSESGYYLQYDENTNTWEQKFNPDVEMLKRYLRGVIK